MRTACKDHARISHMSSLPEERDGPRGAAQRRSARGPPYQQIHKTQTHTRSVMLRRSEPTDRIFSWGGEGEKQSRFICLLTGRLLHISSVCESDCRIGSGSNPTETCSWRHIEVSFIFESSKTVTSTTLPLPPPPPLQRMFLSFPNYSSGQRSTTCWNMKTERMLTNCQDRNRSSAPSGSRWRGGGKTHECCMLLTDIGHLFLLSCCLSFE